MGALLIGGIVGALVLWVLFLSRNKDSTPHAFSLDGAKPSFVVKGRLHHSLGSLNGTYGEFTGIKFSLALYKGVRIVRVIVHNNSRDVLDLKFDDLDKVRYLVTPMNEGALILEVLTPFQVGDSEKDDFVLTFSDGGPTAGSVHEQLRDWLDPNTTFVFEFQGGGQSVEKGRGGAMKA
jgi:hypothetical protein